VKNVRNRVFPGYYFFPKQNTKNPIFKILNMLLNTKNKRFFLKPFWAKFQYYKSLKSDKISKVFGQIFKKKSKFSEKNQNLQKKSKCSEKIKIFRKNRHFKKKSRFFGNESTFWSKVEIFIKNPNLDQKSNFS